MSKWKLSNDEFGLNLLNLPYAPRFATFSRGVMSAAETEELARLLSAAPEMLEALKFLMSHVNHYRSTFSLAAGRQGAFEATFDRMSAYIENLDALTGKIEAAIAKAQAVQS